MSTAEPSPYAIVVATFYRELADALVRSAADALPGEPEIFEVPGAFELPLAASYAARSGRFAGVVCLGAVIRGETDHYDWVCGECASGIQQVQLGTGVPCSFGLLTVDSMEQAIARAGGGKRDSGRSAAEAVLEMAALRERFVSG